ncbi:MAG: Uncharacterised protein [Cryomorphaceae bacterium]|nr:MAG: Uncharacterised protein [Cryomorphaceae bacterium]
MATGKSSRPNHKEEFTYLLLEDNDQDDESCAHEGAKEFTEETHFKQLDQAVQKVNGDHSQEDTDGSGAFQQSVNLVQQECCNNDI